MYQIIPTSLPAPSRICLQVPAGKQPRRSQIASRARNSPSNADYQSRPLVPSLGLGEMFDLNKGYRRTCFSPRLHKKKAPPAIRLGPFVQTRLPPSPDTLSALAHRCFSEDLQRKNRNLDVPPLMGAEPGGLAQRFQHQLVALLTHLLFASRIFTLRLRQTKRTASQTQSPNSYAAPLRNRSLGSPLTLPLSLFARQESHCSSKSVLAGVLSARRWTTIDTAILNSRRS